MKSLLKKIILENQEVSPPNGVIRQYIDIPIQSGIIISIIGARRSGKTYLLKQTIQKLKASGTSAQQIVFINFEDERLMLQQDQLDLIIQAYTELYPDQKLQETYLLPALTPSFLVRKLQQNYGAVR